MVIVSHQLSSIFRLADRVIVLDRQSKGIIAEGSPAELAATSTDPRVRDFLNEDEDFQKPTNPPSARRSFDLSK
jgi:phospholipid/cholesterol/gamma-HCH transport system ATP-binding protein